MKKRVTLEEKARRRNKDCYKAQVARLFYFDCARYLVERKEKPRPRIMCENEREYLGASLLYILTLMSSLRDDQQFFTFFVGLLDSNKKLSEGTLNSLAEEIVFLLLSDVGSYERSYLISLRHFDFLLPVLQKMCEAA